MTAEDERAGSGVIVWGVAAMAFWAAVSVAILLL